MHHTTFDPSLAMTYPVALPHGRAADGGLQVQHTPADNACFYPGAFAFSTVLDVACFARLHLNGGMADDGTRLLDPSLIRQMYRPHGDFHLAEDIRYGLTFYLDRFRGRQRIGHEGNFLSYGGKLVLVPAAGAGVMLIGNYDEEFKWVREELINEMLGLLVADDRAEAAAPPSVNGDRRPAAAPESYVGDYLDAELDRLSLALDGTTLVMHRRGRVVPLRRVDGNRYFAEHPPVDETWWFHSPYTISLTLSLALLHDPRWAPSNGGPPGAEPRYISVNGRVYHRVAETPTIAEMTQ
jgi:hypothetical protein